MSTHKHRFGDVATTRELLQECTEAGVDVTGTRLARWVKYGLMDAPKKRGMGAGNGSVQVWPPGSLERAAFIARTLQEGDRSLESAAQALIADGQHVRPELLRTLLDNVARTVEENLHDFGDTDVEDLQTAITAAGPMLARVDAHGPLAGLPADLGFLKNLTPDSFRQSVAALDDAQLAAAFDDAGAALAALSNTFRAVLLPLGLIFAGTLFAQLERQHKTPAIGPINAESLKALTPPVPLKATIRLLLTLWFARARAAQALPAIISG